MTLFIGLTGSIGMGKSTTAQMFRDQGIAVYDADATVHDLYESEAVALIESEFPGTTANGRVDRQELSKHVVGNDEAMKRLEAIIHPLVREREMAFRKKAEEEGQKIAILDIPLLFETGREHTVDGIVVVTAPAELQRERVVSRPGMTEEKFNAILARQTPDSVKREKADFVIDTSLGMEAAEKEVADIIDRLSCNDLPDSMRDTDQNA